MARTRHLSEPELLQSIWDAVPVTRPDVMVPVGDDAAVFRAANIVQVITVDSVVAERHFSLAWASYEEVGAMAIEVAASDIVAMGAHMQGAMIQLTLGEAPETEAMADLHRGIGSACQRLGLVVYGGNITARPGPLEISVTVLGFLQESEHPVRRSGAVAGERIVVSGALGGAALALQRLGGGRGVSQAVRRPLVAPRARSDLIEYLQTHATSAIDISDGLASELHHLAAASRCGFVVREDLIPCYPEAELNHALFGGGDYEILATVKPGAPLAQGLVEIGRVSLEPGVWLQNSEGVERALQNRGFDHLLIAPRSE